MARRTQALLRSAVWVVSTLYFAAPLSAAVLRVPADFPTIQRAIDAANPGDRILPNAGKYTETIITKKNGTTSDPITLDGRNVVNLSQLVLRNSHFHLLNCGFTGAPERYTRYLYFDYGSHFCVVSNNVIDLDAALGVYGIEWRVSRFKPFGQGEVGSDNLVVSNTLKNGKGYILMSIMGDRNVIQGNRLIDSPAVDMFRLFGQSNIIRGNYCLNSPYAEGYGNHPDFIQTFGNNGDGSRGHIIEDNVVMKLDGAQITQLEGNLMPEISDWLFRNNLFVDIAMQASCTIPNVRYYNNTFIRCNSLTGGHALAFGTRTYQAFSTYTGATGTNSAHGAEVVNNIFVDCGNTNYNRGWYGFSPELTRAVANYNYVAKSGYEPVRADPLRRVVGSPTGWYSFGWYEPNGINGGDPRFMNPSLDNYRLLPESPLADRGFPTPYVTKDFDGVPRPQGAAWSFGAFEPRSSATATRPMAVTNLRVVSE